MSDDVVEHVECIFMSGLDVQIMVQNYNDDQCLPIFLNILINWNSKMHLVAYSQNVYVHF